MDLILTKAQTRKIILHAAGLSKPAQFGKGREAAFKVVDHLGFVQVDINYAVERAHHHAIASRVPDYKTEWLEELQTDARVFEFQGYFLGYIPMHDYRFTLPVHEYFISRRKKLSQAEKNLMERVLDKISRDGALMSKDFENDRIGKGGAWNYGPTRIALDRLAQDGKLIALRRKDFLKQFDIPKNIVPDDIDTTMPSDEEFANYVIQRSLNVLGIAYLKDITHRARFAKNKVKSVLEKLVAEGEVLTVGIGGMKTAPLYMLSKYKNKKIDLSGDVFILSPFDMLNAYRHRLREFFDFDYQVELAVPEAKRKYGFFACPVLMGDTFIARMDSKADRKQKILTINNLHFEPGKLTEGAIDKLSEAIKAFAKFNQCKEITIIKCNNKSALKIIRNDL
jgi:uncharacterized protein YcaQ